MSDMFRPRFEPSRTIYDAFQEEAKYREGRTVEQWNKAERKAVWHAADAWCRMHKLEAPFLTDVIDADRYATGHNYGAQWAYKLTDIIRERNNMTPREWGQFVRRLEGGE
jgi:hypothetical protein